MMDGNSTNIYQENPSALTSDCEKKEKSVKEDPLSSVECNFPKIAKEFQRHIEFLEENIDPDSGLLDKLRSNRTLSFKETSDIKDQHPFYKRNSLLLQFIIDKKKYDCLINALIVTGQAHIANFLSGNGKYSPKKFGDEWPLRDSELSALHANNELLVDRIDPGELVGRLYSKGVINGRQREAISSKLACYEKNETLLEILNRRSLKDFKVTIRCLHETNQSHLAQMLEQQEVVARDDDELFDDIAEDEDDEYTVSLSSRPCKASKRCSWFLCCRTQAVEKDNLRTDLELYCLVPSALQGRSRQWRVICEAESSITSQSDEELTFVKHLEFLKKNIDPDSGLLDKLRFNRILSFKQTSDIKDLDPFYKRNSLLLQYIIDNKKSECLMSALKETGQKHIVNFLIGKGEYTAKKFGEEWPLMDSQLGALDVNKQCLRDLLESDKLVEPLFSRGVINRRQKEAISSKLTIHEKNEALLEILNRRSLKDFKTTIQCLRESNQSHIAQIIEEGEAKSLEESRRILEGITLLL